jgi:amino acid transporter
MIISMCEEVQEPATQVPKAMVATILINLGAGLMFLLPLLFVIPDLSTLAALASGQPVPTIIATAVGSPGGAIGLLLPLMVLGLICGIGCTTAASRCVWAFSRDGAIPGSKWWKQVNNTTALEGVPLNAMLLSMVVQILLAVIYFGSVAAYNAFSGVGVICLTVSYAIPIATNLFTGRKHVKGAPFALGAVGLFCNIVALAWSCLAVPLFCMPTTVPVTATLMNYASVVFVAFILIAGAWYIVWGKKNYQGPPTHEDTALETRRSLSDARRASKVAP